MAIIVKNKFIKKGKDLDFDCSYFFIAELFNSETNETTFNWTYEKTYRSLKKVYFEIPYRPDEYNFENIQEWWEFFKRGVYKNSTTVQEMINYIPKDFVAKYKP